MIKKNVIKIYKKKGVKINNFWKLNKLYYSMYNNHFLKIIIIGSD